MAKRAPRKPSWTDVKKAVAQMDRKELHKRLADLYRFSGENQAFLHARFGIGRDPLEPYRETIEECMYPDVFSRKPVRISKAKKTVSDYAKAAADPLGEIDLMIFFVETGNRFTLDYGDIDEPFYNALNSMYERAVKKVVKLPADQRAAFKERLKKIMTSTSNKGIIDRVDFNATTHGQRDIEDDRLSNLIEKVSEKRLGLADVEPDIIGRSYEFLIRKFAEGSGRSAGLLIKCELVLEEKMAFRSKQKYAPLQLFGQEYIAGTWAMANMNMIIHDMEGRIEIGDTFRHPKFRQGAKLQTFDRVVANPMWNQGWFTEQDYDNDELGRFPQGAGFPGKQSADWG